MRYVCDDDCVSARCPAGHTNRATKVVAFMDDDAKEFCDLLEGRTTLEEYKQPTSILRLYVVTRSDIPSLGLRASQLYHAGRQFADKYPEIEREWFTSSNTLSLLEVENVEKLMSLLETAALRGIKFSTFNEPDMNGALTAVAFEPSRASQKLLTGIKTFASE